MKVEKNLAPQKNSRTEKNKKKIPKVLSKKQELEQNIFLRNSRIYKLCNIDLEIFVQKI